MYSNNINLYQVKPELINKCVFFYQKYKSGKIKGVKY